MTSKLRAASEDVAWLEPVQALHALQDMGPLLLDGMGAHPDARHAYVAMNGRLDVRFDGHHWTILHDDGRAEIREGEPLDVLQSIIDEWSFDATAPGFNGGFVGIIGYEFASAIEPTLPRRQATTPQVVLRLCRDALVFDRVQQTVRLWCHDLPGENDAAQRRAAIREQLARAGPVPSLAGDAPEWTPAMGRDAFVAAVHRVKDHVRSGDLFQANIATRFDADWTPDPVALFTALQQANPSPFMALMDWGDHAIVSNSPEQLFGVENGVIRARPIAGTRPRQQDAAADAAMEQELLTDAKEQAEHTMLVDLLRNDIARVAEPGTVHVRERGSVERYRRVMHLVSSVEATVRDGTRFVDWLAALFPGGTITGAPKHRACIRIHEAEEVPRGPYTGSAGFLSWDQSTTQWNILIRTMVLQGGRASVHAGSGIVAGSDPAREWDEAGHKAGALLDAASDAGTVDRVGEVTAHGQWSPPEAPGFVDARVLLIDNYDSFVHNLADYCQTLGAQVLVVRNDDDVEAARAAFNPTHVILSPGPGRPEDAGATARIARDWLGQLPILGVCLGHQALGYAAGATVHVTDAPVHGEVDDVANLGGTLQQGLPPRFQVARYHSLIVDEPAPPWQVTARLDDGTVMAMENAASRAFGLQYHPESIGTPHGLDILIHFLRTQ